MQITDVIRGDDHLSNTPLQVAILQALSRPVPRYAHLPMILDPAGRKLSKRFGAASVEDYTDFLPGALLSHLALLGWHPGTEQTIFTLDDLVSQFSLDRVGASPARFDIDQLRHVNAHMIRELGDDAWLAAWPGHPGVDALTAKRVVQEKIVTWADAPRLLAPLDDPLVIEEDIGFSSADRELLRAAHEALSGADSWDEQSIGAALRAICDAMCMKPRKAIPVVQQAVMGQRRGASLFTMAELIGRERVIDRISAQLT
jgi:glutamyl/glutaminyl-tRNA synthetase